ncbi:MAG: hypothetical protein ACJ8DC_17725 [Gemmatimonadales bacterium]
MKRSMFGVLALVAGMSACSGDPTGDLRDEVVGVVADPTSVFVAQDDSVGVIVSAIDGQGNALDVSDLTFQAGDASISAADDPTYLAVNIGTQLQQSRRLFVKGVSPASTVLTLSTNGKSLDLPVRVTPITVAATFSTATPAANELLTITLPAGFKFGAGAGVSSLLTGSGIIASVSADSTSADVLLAPGTTGTLVIDSVTVDFAPGVKFSLPTTDSVTVGAVTPLAGTDAPGTAPAVTIPAAGAASTVFFDGGTFDYPAPIFGGAFGDFPSRLYKIVVADSTTLTTTVDWPSAEDLGIYFFEADGTTETGTPGDAGAGGIHPETTTNTFAPGTYLMAIVNFNLTNPPYFGLTITQPAAEAP